MPIGNTNIICSDCLGIDKTCFQRKYFFLYSFCGIEIEKGKEKQIYQEGFYVQAGVFHDVLSKKTGSDCDIGHRVGDVFTAQHFLRIFSSSG